MMADIGTVLWKELRELFSPQGGLTGTRRGGWLSVLLIVVVFGVVLPYQIGPDWVRTPSVLLFWAWVPLFLVTSITADTFAGERERRTLESLLATRLSDHAILLGKVAAAILYGWGLTLISLLLGVVTINVAFREGGFQFYAAGIAVSGLALSLLGAGLAASAGVLVSLRAGSVRQAAQTITLAMMVLLFGPMFAFRALPPVSQARVIAFFSGGSLYLVVAVAVAVLLVLNAVLLAAAAARFQRARLILD